MKLSKPKKRSKIGLALSGGGVKGLAHIGVIKTLEKNNIPIDFIAGTSVGAIVGGYYAAFKDVEKLEGAALSSGLEQIFSLMENPILGSGFVDENEIFKFIKGHLGNRRFSDLKIPFCAVSTSVKSGDAVYIEDGNVFQAVRASMAIPPFFSPAKIHNKLLIDGAFSCPIPVQKIIKMGADVVIAVNLEDDYIFKWNKFRTVFGLSLHSISIFIRSLAAADAQSANVVISPKVGKYGWGDLNKAKDIIKAGEKAARFKIEDIKSELNFPIL